jgi:hypothetical protein
MFGISFFSEDNSIISYYELSNIAAEFIVYNQNNGYKNPLLLEVIIKRKSDIYEIKFSVYYKINNLVIARDKFKNLKIIKKGILK